MPELEQKLQDFLTSTHGSVELTELKRISDGWENDVYSFTYREQGQQDGYSRILRIYPGDTGMQKSTHEFSGMKQLYAAGYPVPEVLHHTADTFYQPAIIMEFIPGISVEDMVRQSSSLEANYIQDEFVQLFVDLHSLDVTSFLTPELPAAAFDDPYWFVNGLMQLAQGLMSGQIGEAFAQVMAWLGDHMQDVPCEKPAVMHGDYHDRNVLWSTDNKPYVIDWTNWQIGDFRYDLAWTLLLQGSYGNPQEGIHFLESYEDLIGHPVENLVFYEIVAATRRLLDMLRVFYQGSNSSGLRPEAADLIRKYPAHVWTVYEQLCDRTNQQHEMIRVMLTKALE